MKNPNRTAIRAQLPYGTLSQIAGNLGLTTRIVSEYFVKGWHLKYEPAILEQAVSIIESQRPSGELGDRIEDLGLTGASFVTPKRKKRSESVPGMKGNTIILVLGILAILAYLFIPAVKTAVVNLIAKIKGQ